MEQTRAWTKTAMMAALVFLAVYVVKIPSINGYTHLGDCMILMGVLVLGWKKGALAGGIGAALADFLGGYFQWVLPTFVIKGAMAMVMGWTMEKLLPQFRSGWLVGAILGGLLQIAGYTAMKILYYGFWTAMTMTPTLLIQTAAGWILTGVLVGVLQSSGVLAKLQRGKEQ